MAIFSFFMDEIIMEGISLRDLQKRGGRADDKRSETAMEDRKKQGYF
jgi:sulfate adenylyltransferase subunit 2